MASWPYCTARWQVVREQQLTDEPLCRYCREMGYTTEAVEVDHIQPIRLRPDLAFTRSNLQSLCKPCHSSVKQREESTGHRVGNALSGEPIDERHHWNS